MGPPVREHEPCPCLSGTLGDSRDRAASERGRRSSGACPRLRLAPTCNRLSQATLGQDAEPVAVQGASAAWSARTPPHPCPPLTRVVEVELALQRSGLLLRGEDAVEAVLAQDDHLLLAVVHLVLPQQLHDLRTHGRLRARRGGEG